MNLYIVNYAPPPPPSISLSILFLSFLFLSLFLCLFHSLHSFFLKYSYTCISLFPEEAEMYSCTLYVNQQEI